MAASGSASGSASVPKDLETAVNDLLKAINRYSEMYNSMEYKNLEVNTLKEVAGLDDSIKTILRTNLPEDKSMYGSIVTRTGSIAGGKGHGRRQGGGALNEDTTTQDVMSIGNLIHTDREPASYVNSADVGNLLSTPPAATSGMTISDNSAYLLKGDNFEYMDRPLRGGGAAGGSDKKSKKSKSTKSGKSGSKTISVGGVW